MVQGPLWDLYTSWGFKARGFRVQCFGFGVLGVSRFLKGFGVSVLGCSAQSMKKGRILIQTQTRNRRIRLDLDKVILNPTGFHEAQHPNKRNRSKALHPKPESF